MSFSGKTKIYAIRDNHWIRYVGKTIRLLESRLAGHLRDARRGDDSHKGRGIRKMLCQGRLPSITLIEEVEGNGDKEEKAWIKFFRDRGIDLWNETAGGEGGSCPGKKRSLESRKRISEGHMGQVAWNKGKPWSKEVKKKLSLAKKGRHWTPEHCANISKALTGHRPWGISEERSRKISEKLKGRHPSEATREKLRQRTLNGRISGMKGKHHSVETLLKLSKARKGIPWTEARRVAQQRRICV